MKKLLFSALLLLATTLTVADSLFGLWRNDSETVTVPSYCGLREEEIEAPDWLQITAEYRHDTAAEGTVIAQTPPGGSEKKLVSGGTVALKLTVSLGEETLRLPALQGRDAREAAAELRALGLTVVEKPTSGAAAGTVEKTDPPAETHLTRGATVVLYVGQATAAETVTVPDFSGLSRANALLQLYLANLSAGELSSEPSALPAGTVIRQSPAPGSQVPPSTRIRLVLSSGEE